jgi:hypothetical protein
MVDSYHTLRLTTCEEVFRHLLLVTKRRESIDLQLQADLEFDPEARRRLK